jgi:uncharacterized PurR-regulated membrane protein YhhQ (DUF165 family)
MWIYDLKLAIREMFSEEKAQGMIEYAIVIAVVAIISAVIFMSENGDGKKAFDAVNGLYDETNNAIEQIEVQNVSNN